MDSPEQVLLETQLKRITTRLFKDFLIILEDVRQEHLSTLASFSGQFPPEILNKLNYLDLAKYSKLRKKVLDGGNDSIREISSLLKDFNISLDNKDKA